MHMQILIIYFVGFLVYMGIIYAYNRIFDSTGDGRMGLPEALMFSIASWITVVLLIVAVLLEAISSNWLTLLWER